MIDFESILPKKEPTMCWYSTAIDSCITALKQAEKEGKICEPLSVDEDEMERIVSEALSGSRDLYATHIVLELIRNKDKWLKSNAAIVAKEG